MANQEHLDILKQGVEVWNQWRKEQPEILPDLREADLREVNLSSADFQDADLSRALLGGADLSGAHFRRANLSGTNLHEANLSYAMLIDTNLSKAILWSADLTRAILSYANLSKAFLFESIFNSTLLIEVDLSQARMSKTIFVHVDLRSVKGLETVEHNDPSSIAIDTLILSQGDIPEIFLRSAGLPDSFIEYGRSLVNHPIEYYTCFISYSSKDGDFAKRLYVDLQSNNVRCWFAPEDMDIGDKIRTRIDESIRLYDKLLLVLSKYSIASNWVAYEVERALNKEPEGVPNVLYPIRLDDAVMKFNAGWAEDIKRTRHIGDFTDWKNQEAYQKAFTRLLRALKAKVEKAEEL